MKSILIICLLLSLHEPAQRTEDSIYVAVEVTAQYTDNPRNFTKFIQTRLFPIIAENADQESEFIMISLYALLMIDRTGKVKAVSFKNFNGNEKIRAPLTADFCK